MRAMRSSLGGCNTAGSAAILAMAAVSETLAEAGVSIDSFLQKPVEDVGGVPIVLTTHAVAESVLTAAIEKIAALPAVLQPPRLLRIARI